ncbi:hypothetical protein tb265_20180 [Gemmatimonadetes bacterium T265]|nr:hypothetical protein tb265_20180 [Gemmatimonadetes bacterium T265]
MRRALRARAAPGAGIPRRLPLMPPHLLLLMFAWGEVAAGITVSVLLARKVLRGRRLRQERLTAPDEEWPIEPEADRR